MGVETRTIIVTNYNITCDYCGRVEQIDNSFDHTIYNRRNAVRSLGWTLQRGDRVMCSTCRCYENIKRRIT